MRAKKIILFEYLNLLVSRPDIRTALGAAARSWVETECTWPKVARQVRGFSGAHREAGSARASAAAGIRS